MGNYNWCIFKFVIFFSLMPQICYCAPVVNFSIQFLYLSDLEFLNGYNYFLIYFFIGILYVVRHCFIFFGSLHMVFFSALDIFKVAYLKSFFTMTNICPSLGQFLLTAFFFLFFFFLFYGPHFFLCMSYFFVVAENWIF